MKLMNFIYQREDHESAYLQTSTGRAKVGVQTVKCLLQCNIGPTDRYLWNFFPNAIADWNQIISDFEDRLPCSKLKSHLISLYRPKAKSIFDTYNPTLLRHLFQLRLVLSQLKYHKKRHDFKDIVTDQCLCKLGIKDSRHFFWYAPFLLLTEKV